MTETFRLPDALLFPKAGKLVPVKNTDWFKVELQGNRLGAGGEPVDVKCRKLQ